MNNYDQLISKVFFKDNKLYNKYFKRFFKNPKKYKNKYFNIKEYLLNRYDDSEDIRETLYRIYRHIEKRPVCKTCGNKLNLMIVNNKNQVFPTYCSISCEMKDPNVMKKHNECCQKKYGSVNNSKKTKETCIKRYGVKAGFNNGKEKITKILKYGNENYVNPNKARQTCLEKYGVKSPLCLKNTRLKRKSIESLEKEYQTKKKNNSFNKSNPEEQTYIILKIKYPDTQRQYRSEVYPFNCDFYIPSLDLYIECNYHWTHGGKLFENSEEDNIKLEKWKSKNTRFYNNAIKTWTIRDIEKRNVANENKLNYLVFYNFDNFNNWITNQPLSIYKDEELFKYEYENYLNKEGNLNSYFKISYIIKYFQQDIFYKKENELWNNQEIKNKLIENRRKYLNKELITDIEYLNGFKRSFIYYGYSHFNPLWFKWFIKEYNCKICYDPCGGWGHRLLGSNLLEKYIYNDINREIFNNVNRIIEYFNIKNTICYNNDCNEFIPNEDFDSMFTCPPYYNIENYNKENEFETIEEYNKLIDNLFNIFYNKRSCKVFGIVIREDLLEDKFKSKAKYSFIVNKRKANHIIKHKNFFEYLYIYIKE